MSGWLVEEATITVQLLGKQKDAKVIAADPEISAKIRTSLNAFVYALKP